MVILLTIAPLFLLIAIGFIAVKSGYFDGAHVRPLAELVLKFALPALLFRSLIGSPLSEALSLPFMLAFAAGSLAIFALSMGLVHRLFRLPVSASGPLALGTACSNSGFMGYPIGLALLGPDAGTILAHCLMVENILMIPLAIMIGGMSGRASPAAMARVLLLNFVRTPVVIALAAALVVSSLSISLPAPVMQVFDMLADVSAPVALFVQGATLAALPLGGLASRIGLIAGMKLIGHPLAVGLAIWLVPGIPPVMAAGGVLFAAMPMLSIYPILTQSSGQSALAASSLFVATLLSFATISILTYLPGFGP